VKEIVFTLYRVLRDRIVLHRTGTHGDLFLTRRKR